MMQTWRIMAGNVLDTLASVPSGSVQTCVTSPPYWGLRDYGHAGQLGLEPTPGEYVARMVEVFSEVHRVLRDDGTLWLNLGDSYAGSWGNQGRKAERGTQRRINGPMIQDFGVQHAKECDMGEDCSCGAVGKYPSLASGTGSLDRTPGCKPKDLVGIPWMVAFALRDYGWYLRSDIIWHKPNPMPESVTDRPTKSHEYLFLLTKSARYYYDAEVIAEEGAEPDRVRKNEAFGGKNGASVRHGAQSVVSGALATRNKRSVWTVATQPYAGAHFATYPEALIEPCILAGSKLDDLVLDPFTGSGTTGAVAIRHGRNFLGCELNQAYIELARKRIGGVAPLLAVEVA